MEIRALTICDLDLVLKLFQESFKNDHIYSECGLDISEIPESFKVSIVYAIKDGKSYGCFKDNCLVSFLLGFDYNKCKENLEVMKNVFEIQESGQSIYSELDLFFEETKKHNNLYYIMSIATDIKNRQKGIASKLLDTLLNNVSFDIISDVSSMISIPMYEKRGFKISTLGEDYKLVVLRR